MSFFRLVDMTKHLQLLSWSWFNRRPGVSRRELFRYQARRARRLRTRVLKVDGMICLDPQPKEPPS